MNETERTKKQNLPSNEVSDVADLAGLEGATGASQTKRSERDERNVCRTVQSDHFIAGEGARVDEKELTEGTNGTDRTTGTARGQFRDGPFVSFCAMGNGQQMEQTKWTGRGGSIRSFCCGRRVKMDETERTGQDGQDEASACSPSMDGIGWGDRSARKQRTHRGGAGQWQC